MEFTRWDDINIKVARFAGAAESLGANDTNIVAMLPSKTNGGDVERPTKQISAVAIRNEFFFPMSFVVLHKDTDEKADPKKLFEAAEEETSWGLFK